MIYSKDDDEDLYGIECSQILQQDTEELKRFQEF